ncbi:I66 family serine proteinase inhibitor [Streptomyces sp. NPDC050704]|uniref:I66 family serine proteinase inhibitor n=1 Tax=Streptomyces sp. NPDC050704 TaxID=3157219 RepID=UPI003427D89B
MADTDTVVGITVNGANVTVIDDMVFAALLPEPLPSQWTILPVNGGIQLQEKSTGRYLAVPDTELYTQAEARSTDAKTRNSTWIAYRIDDDSNAATDKIQETGMFLLKLADTDLYLGRQSVEDRSLLPKRVALVPEQEQTRLVLVVQN